MMSGMYAAISGLDAHQTMLDVTANNLANVDTVGFKAQRTTFVDELSQLVRAGAGPNGSVAGSNPEEVGLGVTVGSIDISPPDNRPRTTAPERSQSNRCPCSASRGHDWRKVDDRPGRNQLKRANPARAGDAKPEVSHRVR